MNSGSPVSVEPPHISQGNSSLYDAGLRAAASETSYLSNSLPAKRGFKIASLNVNSLIKHIDDLRIFLADNNPVDVLAIDVFSL